jgi:hypothetical protein
MSNLLQSQPILFFFIIKTLKLRNTIRLGLAIGGILPSNQNDGERRSVIFMERKCIDMNQLSTTSTAQTNISSIS